MKTVKAIGSKLMATLFVLGFFQVSSFAQGDNGITGSSLNVVQIVLGTLLVIALIVAPLIKGSNRSHRHI